MVDSHPHWLVIGAGYTGARLCRQLLAEGREVTATRRSAEGAAELARELGWPAGLRVLACMVGDGAGVRALPFRGAVVVVASPPDPAGPVAEAELARAAAAGGAHRLIYVSSTGVYPPGRGEWVDEEEHAQPAAEHGRRRLDAEQEILARARELGLPAVSLRAAGIYGPGRGVHLRVRAGTHRVLGSGDTYVSRIHVDDLVAAVRAAAAAEPLVRDAYNVADDEPTTAREIADGIAELLGLPAPPAMADEDASPLAREFLTANRKVGNQRLKRELGVALRYPTWREGVRQAMEEEGDGGG